MQNLIWCGTFAMKQTTVKGRNIFKRLSSENAPNHNSASFFIKSSTVLDSPREPALTTLGVRVAVGCSMEKERLEAPAICSSILRLEPKKHRFCVEGDLVIAVIGVQVCPRSPARGGRRKKSDGLRQLHFWKSWRPEWGQPRGVCILVRKRLSWRSHSSYGTWRWTLSSWFISALSTGACDCVRLECFYTISWTWIVVLRPT